MKTAIITGVAGQDGSYLAELLLSKGYTVYGIHRRVSTGNNLENLSECVGNPSLNLIEGDVCDYTFMTELISSIKPDEFYNLAAQSNVGHSFKAPIETFKINAEAVIAQLEAVRHHSPNTKYYQASTSELFGNTPSGPYGSTLDSKFCPRSPYGVAKLSAYSAVVNAREAYELFACNGVLFNHESPRRGLDFFTRKVTHGIASIKAGKQTKLKLGNLDAYRDIGYAGDYVEAMHLMMQQDKPGDYIVATGHSIRCYGMVEYVCNAAGLEMSDVVEHDATLIRPSEVNFLQGDSGPIRNLGWEPRMNGYQVLLTMLQADLARVVNSDK